MNRNLIKSCVALGVLMATASGTAYATTTIKVSTVNQQASVQENQIESYEKLNAEIENFKNSLTANEKEDFDIVWFDPLLNLSKRYEELKDTKKAYIACSEEVFGKFAFKLKNYRTFLKNNNADGKKIAFIQSKMESMQYHGKLRDESLREFAQLSQAQREALGKFQGKYIADILDATQIDKYKDVMTKLEYMENKYKTGALPTSMEGHSVVRKACGDFVVDISNQFELGLKSSILDRVDKFAQLSELGTDYANGKKYSMNIYAKLDLLKMAGERLTLDPRVKDIFDEVSKDIENTFVYEETPCAPNFTTLITSYVDALHMCQASPTEFKSKITNYINNYITKYVCKGSDVDFLNTLGLLDNSDMKDVYANCMSHLKKSTESLISVIYFGDHSKLDMVQSIVTASKDKELQTKLDTASRHWTIESVPAVAKEISDDSMFAGRNMYNTTALAYNKVVDGICSEITGGNASDYKLTVSEIVPEHKSKSTLAPVVDKVNSICASARETIANSTVVKNVCNTYNGCKASVKNALSKFTGWFY